MTPQPLQCYHALMSLIRRLTELQEQHGHLSDETLRDLARAENVPLHRLQELVSFYPHFRTIPAPRVEVAVCRDMTCWLNGATEVVGRRQQFASAPDVEVREVSCLGRCELAPACAINGTPGTLGDVNNRAIWRHEEALCWRSDPYASPAECYGLLRELLAGDRKEAAARVLSALKEGGLRGMGGAGFPTAAKWDIVRNQTRTPKYVICNADESEPGTFKDRVILSDLPHLVIEGMLLAGLVTGAAQGILFLRHEHEWDRRHFDHALREARQAGLVGDPFDIEVFVSPGGYILGEETALLECLEDRRGEPRNKPPFPGTHGLFGQPTLINNVETLAMIPGIVKRGPAWWKAQGKPGFAGLKFIALSGHVERPGVYEVPMGTTVRELIDRGGGVSGGRALKAFAPGGASSNFLPASMADVPLDFEALAKAGSMLGSGAVVVVAEGTDMLALATNVVRFFRNESCGKCVPCRVGSQKAVELLERVQSGEAGRKELAVLPELGEALLLTSICGLGQVALNPILSVMKHWPKEV
ncbi:MAG TPA: NADH-ubiquinone oxidoreductase-F iron-sulfur binding region domain-containing protein [Gemmataceae bacterium]|nr:NADH-ubiquinone oxidoreductase-F iron-sulfur binding region domain-containing protein [Gemmataceae bacterium]